MVSNGKTHIMQQEYGIGTGTCRRCCNLQYPPGKKSGLICIAYGYREDMNCSWGDDFVACGLFNRPFLGLRPMHRTMADMIGPKQPSSQNDDNGDQLSLDSF